MKIVAHFIFGIFRPSGIRSALPTTALTICFGCIFVVPVAARVRNKRSNSFDNLRVCDRVKVRDQFQVSSGMPIIALRVPRVLVRSGQSVSRAMFSAFLRPARTRPETCETSKLSRR